MLIREPVSEFAPTTTVPAESSTGTGARAWIIGVAAVVALAAIAVTTILLVRGGDSPTAIADPGASIPVDPEIPDPAPPTDDAQARVGTRTIALTGHASVAGGSGRCFGPSPGAFIRFAGIRYEKNFLQCGDRSGDRASGQFVVNLAELVGGTDARITAFSATVGIDEESRGDSSGPAWTVKYGGEVICVGIAFKGEPARCAASRLDLPIISGARLIMEQEAPTANAGLSLWAAFHQPQVTVAYSPPTGDQGTEPEPTGLTFDTVAFSQGEGVRYRYSPVTSDLAPGNGPFEGDSVTVYCYTLGESVRGNSNWAKIEEDPAKYVPATYLREGNAGSVPAGVPHC